VTATQLSSPVPRIALTIAEAAAATGMSEPTFRRWLLPHLKVVRIGTKTCVRIRSLEDCLATLEEAARSSGISDQVVSLFGARSTD